MRAAVLSELGSPRLGTFDEPPDGAGAGDGRVVVDVLAAGLNPIDVATASGRMPVKPQLPSIAAAEGVGTVNGSRFYFGGCVAPYGSLAERTLVDEARLYPVPDGLDDPTAVALGIGGLAGWIAVEWRGALQAGEHVLVLGASGVVGRVAAFAARALGAGRVIGAARNTATLADTGGGLFDDVVALDGGDDLVPRLREAAGDRIDLVIDPLWGAPALAALHAASPGARLVQLGNSASPTLELSPGFMRKPLISILSYSTGGVPPEVKRDAYARMAERAIAGEIVIPTETVALDDVEAAWARQVAGPGVKLIVTP